MDQFLAEDSGPSSRLRPPASMTSNSLWLYTARTSQSCTLVCAWAWPHASPRTVTAGHRVANLHAYINQAWGDWHQNCTRRAAVSEAKKRR